MKTLALAVWFLIGGVVLVLPLSMILVTTGHVGWIFIIPPVAVIVGKVFWSRARKASLARPPVK